MLFSFSKPLRARTVIISVALMLVVFANGVFFKHVSEVYPLAGGNILFVLSLAIVLLCVTVIVLTLLSWRYTLKPVLITILLVSSLVAYFMDAYDVVIDNHMIQNLLETNIKESVDLLSFKQVLYFVLLGVIPSVIVYRLKIVPTSFKETLVDKAKVIGIALVFAIVVIFSFSKYYTSFFREHKPLRYYANPAYYLYSIGHYAAETFSHPYSGIAPIGQDAVISPANEPRKLMILVVGEAVRWDHFGLNGYARDTTPQLRKEDIINFTQFTSCGTETAVSVPCMFSPFGREHYEKEQALHTENVLDVLKRAGVNILWRENNSDSKGVAKRVQFEDYQTSEKNTMCDDGECRDEGMLVGLQEYIDAHPKGDIVIVLHQMGNHGPAYYKRYPKEFEKYTPVCKTNQLEQCTKDEITNAYDNTILYTDTFLSKVIGLLKTNDEHFATGMFYLSDHGESLGENGLYLHGFPYSIAPEAQKHVPAVMWFGKHSNINKAQMTASAKEPHSQDSLFHTLLGFVDVNTTIYQPELDLLHVGR
ncbi:phosphoethanolamine--lipid A transferase [Sulfuricurvum sp.]|uniref:phosphoethanolamine transferase n=1 Tax=Sulfuricurvum sp. TaxID=2025608 RepID=UPI002D489846|nr:phosphoethanolamine--lipid A transferase [Sulfuricurvum sp.]HZF71503.1 phosphoethanolamine--lipid A transferase [Sulfuricurvum sp.]